MTTEETKQLATALWAAFNHLLFQLGDRSNVIAMLSDSIAVLSNKYGDAVDGAANEYIYSNYGQSIDKAKPTGGML